MKSLNHTKRRWGGVNFIPDAPKAAKEMRRVTKSGGVVATTMWDGSGANELNACLWEAAIPMDPIAKRTADRRGCSVPRRHFQTSRIVGLTDIEDAAFAMHCQFSSFDEPVAAYEGAEGF